MIIDKSYQIECLICNKSEKWEKDIQEQKVDGFKTETESFIWEVNEKKTMQYISIILFRNDI